MSDMIINITPPPAISISVSAGPQGEQGEQGEQGFTEHNESTGIQGGDIGEYFHLNEQQFIDTTTDSPTSRFVKKIGDVINNYLQIQKTDSNPDNPACTCYVGDYKALGFDVANYVRNVAGGSMVVGSFHPLVLTGANGFNHFGDKGFGNPSVAACVIVRNVNSAGNDIFVVDTADAITNTGRLLVLKNINQDRFTVGPMGRTSIGYSITNDSAALDVSGILGAILNPRMTTAQRDALTPANGMQIYNTDLNDMQFYVNGAWRRATWA